MLLSQDFITAAVRMFILLLRICTQAAIHKLAKLCVCALWEVTESDSTSSQMLFTASLGAGDCI